MVAWCVVERIERASLIESTVAQCMNAPRITHPAPQFHLMAIGLRGEPTALVNGNGGPQKKNS